MSRTVLADQQQAIFDVEEIAKKVNELLASDAMKIENVAGNSKLMRLRTHLTLAGRELKMALDGL